MKVNYYSSSKGGHPPKFVAIGDTVRVGSCVFRCIERPKNLLPRESCRDCAFRIFGLNCGSYQCSSFDRRDKKMAWFIAE